MGRAAHAAPPARAAHGLAQFSCAPGGCLAVGQPSSRAPEGAGQRQACRPTLCRHLADAFLYREPPLAVLNLEQHLQPVHRGRGCSANRSRHACRRRQPKEQRGGGFACASMRRRREGTWERKPATDSSQHVQQLAANEDEFVPLNQARRQERNPRRMPQASCPTSSTGVGRASSPPASSSLSGR